MIFYFKCLIISLMVAAAVFILIKNAVTPYIGERGYKQAWLTVAAATGIVFLMPIPALVLLLLAILGNYSNRSNGDKVIGALSIYCLILVSTPPVEFSLGNFGGINKLLDVTVARALGISLLIPPARALLSDKSVPRSRYLIYLDAMVIGYEILSSTRIWLGYPDSSLTNLVRLVLEIFLDEFLPYYVITRGMRSKADFMYVLSFLSTGLIFCAGIAVAEAFLKWHLYSGLQELYGIRWQISSYVYRGDSLRVEAMAPQPILLAFTLMFGFGIFVAICGRRLLAPRQLMILGILLMGIYSTYSRGPLLATVFLTFSMWLISRLPMRVYRWLVLGIATLFIGVKAAGADEVIMTALSSVFGHSAEEMGTIDYRRQLLDTSLELLKQSPWLGVPDYAMHMEHLRQGEGIIDLVNSYISIALNTGLLGLAMFIGPYFMALQKFSKEVEQANRRQIGVWGTVPVVFISLIIASMFAIFTTSSWGNMPFLLMLLKALPAVWNFDKKGAADNIPNDNVAEKMLKNSNLLPSGRVSRGRV